MKKIIFTTVICLIFNLASSQIIFGEKAGLSASNFAVNESVFKEKKIKPGLFVGAFLNIKVSSKFSIQPELVYSQAGSKVTYYNEDSAFIFKTDYINLPIMIQYNIIPNLYLEVGPQFGYLIRNIGKSESQNFIQANFLEEESNKFEYAASAGLGYYFNKNIGLTGRYTYGFGNIFKENLKLNNRVIEFGIVYRFTN